MIIALEIALCILGIAALVTGKLSLSGTQVVYGTPARLLGLVAIAPMPVAFSLCFVIGFFLASSNPNINIAQYNWLFVTVELVTLAICFVAVFAIGFMFAGPPKSTRPRRDRYRDDDFDAESALHPKLAPVELVEAPPPASSPPPIEPSPFACTSCGTMLRIPAALVGKKVRCSKCQTVVAAPCLPTVTSDVAQAVAERPLLAPTMPLFHPSARSETDASKPRRRQRDEEPEPSRGMSVGMILMLVFGGLGTLAVMAGAVFFFFAKDIREFDQANLQNPKKDIKIVAKQVEMKKEWVKGPPNEKKFDPQEVKKAPEEVKKILEKKVVTDPPVKVALDQGLFERKIDLAGNDSKPASRAIELSFQWAAKAGEIYWLQVRNHDSSTIRVVGPGINSSPFGIPARESFTLRANETTDHEVHVTLGNLPAERSALSPIFSIEHMDGSKPLPIDLRYKGPPTNLPALSSVATLNVYDKRWSAAAFHPDNSSFWMAHNDLTLSCWAHSTSKIKGAYKLSHRLFSLGVDRVGRLYGQIGPAEGHPIQVAQAPVTDISIWEGLDPTEQIVKFPPPTKTIPLRGTVSRFVNSPDGRWLYFFDVQNRKLARINTETVAIDKVIDSISPGTRDFCLTPNGKTLYCCSTANTIDVIDAETFRLTKTIRLDRGSPKSITATDDGRLFMAGSEKIDIYNQNRDSSALVVDLQYASPDLAYVIPLRINQLRQAAEFVEVLPGQKTVLFSGSTRIFACTIVDRPALFQSEAREVAHRDYFTKSRIVISPDGRTVLHDTGSIFAVPR